MRLRLTVQRNGLPAANVLWNVPDSNSTQAYTITRLLEDVNHVIPLEAEHWGLEHYVVEVAGFECLHFSPVAQALKDDDHVSIRPLMTAEERARTLTGRHQISDDGRHLVDGVPFGRPYLRHPNRPAVRIPPRKRRRLDGAEEEADETALLTQNGQVSPQRKQHGLLTNGDTSAGSEGKSRARRASKTVQFIGVEQDDDEDSDEDDDDFAPDGEQEDHVAMEDDSEDDSDSDSDSSSASGSSSGSDASSGSDDSSSGSDSDSGSDASSPPEVKSSKGVLAWTVSTLPTSPKHVAPGQGRPGTRSRNSRRTRTHRLRLLKLAGKLPAEANLKALAQYEAALLPQESPEPEPSKPFSTYTGKRKRVDNEEAAEDVTELEQRKQELMARFGNGTDSTVVQVEEALQPTVLEPAPPSPQIVVEEEQQQSSKRETPKKRLRPDTSAISRILARQAMPSKKRAKANPVVEKTPEPEGASEPDFWKSRINLSAFECWQEEFELSAPSFPFQQHWDPASKLMREKADKKKNKKGGKRQRESVRVEEEEEEKIFLDYDDTDTGATENPDSEIHEAIEDQLRQDVATAAQADLPALPDDMTTLPDLTSGDVKVGAILACKFFDINAITMTPEISNYKTAVIHREGDSGNGAGTICLKIAERDLPKREKKFDSKGNRIYDAADQFYVEDEDEETGLWEGQLAELLEPKLVKAA
ncbi:hypothetical protein CC86DRAFT_374563 [Ophiobolus disseminans]|uniref:DUF7357 domain-containing protein n=1 Tax=Ophiobolus disseminans TaxID=1469910 RepID=A0A6A6ZJI5_9PLEO|nr:hypothetical protein CC86DRAFT_374563 [Ophiobolus disseminans]